MVFCACNSGAIGFFPPKLLPRFPPVLLEALAQYTALGFLDEVEIEPASSQLGLPYSEKGKEGARTPPPSPFPSNLPKWQDSPKSDVPGFHAHGSKEHPVAGNVEAQFPKPPGGPKGLLHLVQRAFVDGQIPIQRPLLAGIMGLMASEIDNVCGLPSASGRIVTREAIGSVTWDDQRLPIDLFDEVQKFETSPMELEHHALRIPPHGAEQRDDCVENQCYSLR